MQGSLIPNLSLKDALTFLKISVYKLLNLNLQTTSLIQINIIMLLSVCLTSGCICHDNVTLLFQCLDRHVVCTHTDETPDGECRPVQRNARKNSLGVWTGSQKAGFWLLPAFLKTSEHCPKHMMCKLPLTTR